MCKIVISELSPPVRSFLREVRRGNGAVIEDEHGRGLVGVIPYAEASAPEQAAAIERLERIQRKVGRTMKQNGKTEEEFDRIVRKA